MIQEAIRHYKYGISHDIFKEPVTTYAELSIDALEKLSVYEQIKWERDVAISQLEDIGCGLGRKMDDVKEAVEKQKVINPIVKKSNNFSVYKCPVCNSYIDTVSEFPFWTKEIYYCNKCGQKLVGK